MKRKNLLWRQNPNPKKYLSYQVGHYSKPLNGKFRVVRGFVALVEAVAAIKSNLQIKS
jgi:hypothetical protein